MSDKDHKRDIWAMKEAKFHFNMIKWCHYWKKTDTIKWHLVYLASIGLDHFERQEMIKD